MSQHILLVENALKILNQKLELSWQPPCNKSSSQPSQSRDSDGGCLLEGLKPSESANRVCAAPVTHPSCLPRTALPCPMSAGPCLGLAGGVCALRPQRVCYQHCSSGKRSCENAQQAVGRFVTAGQNWLIDQGSCVELGDRAVPVRLDICIAASVGSISSAKRRQQAQDASRD